MSKKYSTPSFKPNESIDASVKNEQNTPLVVGDRFMTDKDLGDKKNLFASNRQEAVEGMNPLYEANVVNSKGQCEPKGSESARMRPPPEKLNRFVDHQLRFLLAELLGVTFLLIVVFIAQGDVNLTTLKFSGAPTAPTRTDYFFLSWVRGGMMAVCTYIFWNYGKPQFNPVVTLAYWLLGHITIFGALLRWVIQFAGSLLALVIAYGFVGSQDPTVGVGPVNLAGHNAGYHALWELVGSVIIVSVALWAYTTDRLYREGVTKQMAALDLANKQGVPAGGEGSLQNNQGALRTVSLPQEYQQAGSGPMVSFQIALIVGLAYAVVSYVGYVATGGDGAVNFLFWFPRVINLSGQNDALAISMGIQGVLYFLTPAAGALLAVLIMWLMVYWTRRCAFGSMSAEGDTVDAEDNPYLY